MNRRDLLRRSALTSAALATRQLLAQTPAASAPDPAVKHVLLVTKCHLDVGFTDTQANVVEKYYSVYYPAAITLAAQGHRNATLIQGKTGSYEITGGPLEQYPRYTWTTGSWLLYTYLEQATPAQRKQMEEAIAWGDIAWHALPFSWQTELLSPSMIEGGLAFSQELDRRFGKKTTGAKMTDVPGHTRGLIAPLARAGVTLLDIGVNAASTPPVVPDVFRWQDHRGHEITVLYHRHDYGSTLRIPGSDLAIAVEVKSDNGGPHTLAEIIAIHARLQAEYPNATVQAASFTDVAHAVEPFRKGLPIVTGEIGDTWIYGIPSDPSKVARFRELSRLRDRWLAQGKLHAGDAIDRAYLQHLLLSAEHTWGTDTKRYLDYTHYRPADLAAAEAAHLAGYATMERSWQEKRDNITRAVATLPASLQTEATNRLASITPHAVVTGSKPTSPAVAPAGKLSPLALDNDGIHLAVDDFGAITSLIHKRTGRNWASPQHRLALLTYQTLSAEEYQSFMRRYIVLETEWAPRDFGKPEISCFGARTSDLQTGPTPPALLEQLGRTHQIVLQWTAFPAPGTIDLGNAPPASCKAEGIAPPADPSLAISPENLASPRGMSLTLTLRDDSPTLDLTLTLLGKPANRLPEALWLSFNPVAPDPNGWLLTKSGQPILPSEVLEGGGRRMHAVTGDIRYADPHGALTLTSLDAPVVALGTRSPLNYSPDLPDLTDGLHVSLFNNAWGTNYPQWASGDWQFRFTLTLG